jgi:hypothetical protein
MLFIRKQVRHFTHSGSLGSYYSQSPAKSASTKTLVSGELSRCGCGQKLGPLASCGASATAQFEQELDHGVDKASWRIQRTGNSNVIRSIWSCIHVKTSDHVVLIFSPGMRSIRRRWSCECRVLAVLLATKNSSFLN